MPPVAEADLAARCGPIELLVVDVDGVLTDGVIAIDDRGVETKHFHVHDGSALSLWRKAGKRAAILSGRWAPLVNLRAAELGIAPVIQGAVRKGEPFRTLLGQLGLDARQVCYVGDDLADLPVLLAVGLAACPADARAEVRERVHLVTRAPGGRGAVREVVEAILKHQGTWDDLVASYHRPA
ncbi:MAG TPA: HAD family hydrolase [Isosphaeraceae bacterium]|jgi:3-deoxy-D-manno-octulosonate 8-phosphate phosphatase (KDO 8-P phosphatase)